MTLVRIGSDVLPTRRDRAGSRTGAGHDAIEPGQVWGRWRLHDLVRLYADAHSHDNPYRRDRAQTRLLDYF